MGFFSHPYPWQVFLFLVFALLCFKALSQDVTELPLKFLKAPRTISHLNSATFLFQFLKAPHTISHCTNCTISCKLDNGNTSDCGGDRLVSYQGLQDGNHKFEVCSSGSQALACATYNWTVDTIPPTAYIAASTSFTNALNFSVNVSFSEPCGGFRCSSVNACNLLVYGSGKVIPSSLTVLKPNLQYSLVVELSSSVAYGRVVLVMDKNFCTDTAGNSFTRAENSSLFVHFDRRRVFADVRLHIPEKLIELQNQTRTVLATNNHDKLKVYLYFSEPIVNSSAEILDSLNVSDGTLLPITGENLGSRRFGFQVVNFSSMAIITIDLQSNSIISRSGTPISPIAPVTFLYDAERPAVRLSTTSNSRTKERIIPVSIKFMKPVFGFNSSLLSISGGHLRSFREVTRSKYVAQIHADGDFVSINVPQNVTGDVAGNKNLASNVLLVRHYCVPRVSSLISGFATAIFVATSLASGLLTVSTASLQSVGAFSKPTSLLNSNPARIIFRIVCFIQVFALSRWLGVALPVEYYEFARGIQWSIPYFNLPWENGGIRPIMWASNSSSIPHSSYISRFHDLGSSQNFLLEEESLSVAASVYGLPLTPMEYKSFFEIENMNPEAEYISDPQNSNGWRVFGRSMFWLAVIGGSLILLHALLFFLLKFRKKNSEKPRNYGALTFPRFEIFLIILALPCLSEASAALVRGGTQSGDVVGILLLGVVGFLVLALFLFLSIGITLGKLLQYKEIHREGQIFHWYQDIIRVSLGPGKRGQWTWINQTNSNYLTMFGPLFEDLRGPPKYMLSQISGADLMSMRKDRIIASDDETEDAEAPFIQKVFGILRIYYTFLETVRRVLLGVMAGVYLDNWSSVTPIIILLSITSFQLFFLVLKKPFVKKKVQLVEIITISCQECLFATCFILKEKKLTPDTESKVGIFMIMLFVIGFLAEMMNEWYALYKHTKLLDPAKKHFATGIKTASIGFLLFFTPQKMSRNLERKLAEDREQRRETLESSSSADRNRNSRSRSSGTPDKPWTKQLREMAKASFTSGKERAPSDPSSSRTKWSGFYASKSSDASSQKSSDIKLKPNRLYKDLEAIFASK
ncbi:hypothetical protein M5689_017313 [Euphorbia peplus]|nr:hypothetical protein M5689_017313 [Euphorbia peplus]